MMKIFGYVDNDVKKHINFNNVVCGLKIPGVQSMKIDTPVSKLDIKPTLLEISGIDDNFSLGESMFSTKDYAVISNGTIVANGYYYDGTWYYIDNGMEVDLETIDDDLRKKLDKYVENMEIELDISKSIIINNLFNGKF